jgi:hypothetical protein
VEHTVGTVDDGGHDLRGAIAVEIGDRNGARVDATIAVDARRVR